jgi:methyl-accepting chemotaxis protein
MTIRSKLLIMLLMVGIVPFAVLGIISFSLSSGALQAQSFKELTAMREIKRAQLTAFFDDLVKSVEYVATVGTVQDHFIELAAIAEDEEIGVTSNDYADAIKDFDSDLKSQLGQFSDMYLISETGQVLYTAKAGSDFKASVNDDARIRDSSLARAFKGAMTDKTVFEDFSLYGPANVPLAFLATPIRQGNGKAIGVLAFALSPARLNKEMQVSRTLAESVDIFLVGTDKVFRSAPPRRPAPS